MTPEQMAAIERGELLASNEREQGAITDGSLIFRQGRTMTAQQLRTLLALARQPSQCGEGRTVTLDADMLDRLNSLNNPDEMHPVGCSSWSQEAMVFLDMLGDLSRRAGQ